MMPLALILLSNKIRPEAPQTFSYFAQQGVRTKVISGDNPLTVSEVARRAGIPAAEKFVYARTLKTDAELAKGANWELVSSAGTTKTYIDPKTIPIARIISLG